MAQTISDLTTIDYDDVGSGEPTLLLLPGWCASRAAWNGLLEPLSDHHRVLALDWRDHGASGPAAGDFGEVDLVRDALAVMEDSGARRFVPVALAHAGWVAIDLRRRLRSAILGVVVIDWIVHAAAARVPHDPGAHARTTMRGEPLLDETLLRWAADVDDPQLLAFLDQMAGMPADMWDRAAREVEGSVPRCTPARWTLWPPLSRRCPRCTCTRSQTTTPTCACRSSSPRRTPGSRCSACRHAATSPSSRSPS